ncbi:MAG: polyribonucleotide nucleotidyltransferase [bacterium]|nr:polyribonucleotide nucleotidyltransferase [bacterium]
MSASSSSIKKTIQWGGRELSFEIGRVARSADAAILARYGDTVVLATVCWALPRLDIGYFPLSVEFEEKLYAGGRISSSRFVKREGRPSEHSVLSGRLIDRSIRPLFPKGYNNEVQVILTVLSVDQDNDMDIVGAVGASAALACSSVPWNGPIVTSRIGLVENQFVLNPKDEQAKQSTLDLVVSVRTDGIMMVEAGAEEVPEEKLIEAIEFSHKESQPVIELIETLAEENGKEKHVFILDTPPEKQAEACRTFIRSQVMSELLKNPILSTDDTWGALALKKIAEACTDETGEFTRTHMEHLFEEEFKAFVRGYVFEKKSRIDGRKNDEVRPLSIEVGVLPRTHGTALFSRGQTQALTIATLGSGSLQQLMEGPMGEETKRYMHHYNFPPFCTGEVKRVGWAGRREIGHGSLAERALVPVLPSKEAFPYAVRVVSEIMSSSGSTSMASVCGSTLALMDAGVPIRKPVAGIAMGLMTKEKEQVILTDIGYAEDANGDMDFKVAGTDAGVTALQMDMKLAGVPAAILKEALAKAKEARLFILQKMQEVIAAPRDHLSPYAPKIVSIKIDPQLIGGIIGPGGKMIRKIQEETETVIDIDDDGTVSISGTNEDGLSRARATVEGIVKVPQPGEEYDGTVTRVMNFGAFVEILPGKEGMAHISRLAPEHVERVEDVVNVGDAVRVRVDEVDDRGRVNLVLLTGPKGVNTGADRPKPPRERFGDRGSDRRSFPRRDSYDRPGQNDQRGSSDRSGSFDRNTFPRRRPFDPRGPRKGGSSFGRGRP